MGAEVSLSYKDFTFKKIDSNLKNQEIFEAKIKTGDSYSAFCFNRLNGKEENQFAINATKYLKILRHPGILKYVNCVKNSKNVYLLTEKVSPLPCKIETLDSVEIIAGVFDIIVAVSFLHEKCKLSHNNITVDSIFVTNEGKWKLGGMQYLSSFDTVSEVTLKTKDVFPCPEDDNENTESVKYKGHERDCYAIACLLRGILKDCVDENVLEHNISLFLNAEPSNRPQLASILENDFLRNNYIHIRNFLEKLTVMTNHEKNEFFKCAAKNIYAIPEDIVASKLSPLLFSQLVLLDTDAKKFLHPHIFTSYKERNKMFIDGETNPIFSISNFEKFVIPELFKILKIKDATIRLVFLEYFNQFVHYIPKKSLQHEVLPELLLGLKDTNDVLVSATLRAMADLIPILGGSIVIGDNQSKIFTCALPKANACVSEKQVILQNSSQRKKSKKRAKEKPILETSSNLDNLKSEALEIPITSTPICNDWSKAIPERSSPDGGEDLKVEKISSNTEVANNDWSDWESMGSEDEINNSPSVLEVEPVKTLLELSDDVNIEPISEPMNKSNSMQLNRKPLKLSTPTPVVVKTPDVKEKSDDKKSLGEEFNIFSSFDMQNSEVDLFEGMQPVINKRQEIAVIQPISNTNSFAAVIEDTEQAESGWGDDLNWDPIS